jgi:4a-hydroxytetrahydrobiopterin dehydratase
LLQGGTIELAFIKTIMKDEWKNTGEALHKIFMFSDFKEALSFVNKVGKLAERLNHHPDICLQNYKEVSIKTTTHDTGNSLTEKDHQLTKAIDGLCDEL